MNIGFKPCGLTTDQAIAKLKALGGINKLRFNGALETNLYWYIDTTSGHIACHEKQLDIVLDPNVIPNKVNSLSDLPFGMRKLIGLRQRNAGNPINFSVFDKNSAASKTMGGFDWKDTPEGYEFWENFLEFKKYYLFYTLKQTNNETKLQDKTTSIGRSKDITGSGIRCERCKPTIASGHLRNRETIKF